MGKDTMTAAELQQHLKAGKIQINRKGRLVGDLPHAPKVSGHEAEDRLPQGPRKAKYGNKKIPDPESAKPFDSILEARHGKEYRLLAKAGEIISVTRQPKFFLLPADAKEQIVYIADFLLLHNDHSVEVVDSKGVETPDFKNKVKLFREKHPDLKLTIRHK